MQLSRSLLVKLLKSGITEPRPLAQTVNELARRNTELPDINTLLPTLCYINEQFGTSIDAYELYHAWAKQAQSKDSDTDRLSSKSHPMKIKPFTWILFAPGQYVRNAEGSFFSKDGKLPTRLKTAVHRPWDMNDPSDVAEYHRRLESERVRLKIPDEYRTPNEVKEFVFHKKMVVDLSRPVFTAKEFHSVIQLLAQTEVGQNIITDISNADSGGARKAPFDPFHHEICRLNISPVAEKETDDAWPASRFHLTSSVFVDCPWKRDQFASKEECGLKLPAWPIFFNRGEEVGILALDLIYSYIVDSVIGTNTFDPGIFTEPTSKLNFAQQFVDFPHKREEILEKQRAYIERRRASIYLAAHSTISQFYQQLHRTLSPEDRDVLHAYYQKWESRFLINGVTTPLPQKALLLSYGIDASWENCAKELSESDD